MSIKPLALFVPTGLILLVLSAACVGQGAKSEPPSGDVTAQPTVAPLPYLPPDQEPTLPPETPIQNPPPPTPDDNRASKFGPSPVQGPDAEPLYPWVPQPGDALLARGEAFVDQASVLVLESFPPQYRLVLHGALPTPCHKLRVLVSEPDEQNRIQVDIYSVYDPTAMCIQVLESLEASVPLSVQPGGQYSVWVNGQQVGEIGP
jgi:hypothetical protein